MIKKLFILGFFLLIKTSLLAQGPPIVNDKPIMLGQGAFVLKTLSQFNSSQNGDYWKVPLMLHYLPTANTLVMVNVPLVSDSGNLINGMTIGDVSLMGKYQFYRKDETAKTLRISFKTLQTLPTGPETPQMFISSGKYQGYYGLVLGMESIKYGIGAEVGYNMVSNSDRDMIKGGVGFGLPLLKPTYPLRQINLYFEYQGRYFVNYKTAQIFSSTGIQYAHGNQTFEVSLQVPLMQSVEQFYRDRYTIFLGTRLFL